MLSPSVLEDKDSKHQLTLKQKLYLFQQTQMTRKAAQIKQYSTIPMTNPEDR